MNSEDDGILSTIGRTPLVRLRRVSPLPDASVYAKLESFNPGGSIKDRTAVSMLQAKIMRGELNASHSVVVESSSGNLGIGIAQICRYFGLRFICVVDAKTTEQNLAILRAYHATVDMISEPDPESGDFLPARISRVRHLVSSLPGAFWPNQYANPLNPQAHQHTMREIAQVLAGNVDYLFCATGSCGTIRGCSDYVRATGMRTKIIAVDAAGSVIFGQKDPRVRRLPGHGSAMRSVLLEPGTADHVVLVRDIDAIAACRRLVEQEAILAGGSSGATLAALTAMRDEIPARATCVLIFPDGGDRYLDTIYSDDWVRRHFSQVPDDFSDELSAAQVGRKRG